MTPIKFSAGKMSSESKTSFSLKSQRPVGLVSIPQRPQHCKILSMTGENISQEDERTLHKRCRRLKNGDSSVEDHLGGEQMSSEAQKQTVARRRSTKAELCRLKLIFHV